MTRHAHLETSSIPTELDFRRYRHPQEVTDSMSIETVDTRARAAAAVALVRHRAPETRLLPIAARPVPDHPGYLQVIGSTAPAAHYPVAGASWSTRPSGACYAPAATPTGSTSPRPCGAAPARNRPPNKGSEQSR